MLSILDPNQACDTVRLIQMHHLRYKVFHKALGWKNGLQVSNQMEWDEYDHLGARYLVHINENNNTVDACARLTPTDHPYLLGSSFKHYIQEINIPSSRNVLEVSRLCSSPDAPRNITGQLMAGMLEYAIDQDVTHYVSLSSRTIIPVVKRYGWQSHAIGPFLDTGTEISVALSYDVTPDFHDNVKRIIGMSQEERILFKRAYDCQHYPFQ